MGRGVYFSDSHIFLRFFQFLYRTSDGLDSKGSISDRGFFCFPQRPRRPQVPSCMPTRGTGILSPKVKRPGHEADHLPPSNAEVKKGGATSPFPYMPSWLGV
jgi:hypothetical protein